MDIPGADSRICTMECDYQKSLQDAGYTDLVSKKPHICIEHIMDRIKPEALHEKMIEAIQYWCDEGLDKKDFFKFLKEVVREAKLH